MKTKEQVREQQAAYYIKNKARIKAVNAAYYVQNPDKALLKAEGNKLYAERQRQENPERLKAARAAHHEANAAKDNARSLAYYARNKNVLLEQGADWRQRNATQVKTTHAAYRKNNAAKIKAHRIAFYQDEHKALARKQTTRAWIAANPNAGREYNNTRRARKIQAGGTLSKGLALVLLAQQKGLCNYCGTALNSAYHLDHRTPLALGGPNCDHNMQLLCKRCNLQKGAMHPDIYEQALPTSA